MENISKHRPDIEGKKVVDQIIEPYHRQVGNPKNLTLNAWVDEARGERGGVEDFVVSLLDALGWGAWDYFHALMDVPGAPERVLHGIKDGLDWETALRSAYEWALERSIREEVASRFGGWR